MNPQSTAGGDELWNARMLAVVRMGKAALVCADMRGLKELHFSPFTVNYRENSAIKAATLESVEFSFLECFFFFFFMDMEQ